VLSDPEAPASQAIRTIAEQLGKRPRGLAGLSLGISSVRQK
jgi:ATP-binding protein involved in chromosome partitioning